MKPRWRARWLATGLALLALNCHGVERGELRGYWQGSAVVAGNIGYFGIYLEEDDSGTLTAAVSMVNLGVARQPVGPASCCEDGLSVVGQTFRYDATADALVGKIPAALAPVHGIEIALYRAEPPELDNSRRVAPVPDVVWSTDVGSAVYAELIHTRDSIWATTLEGCVVQLSVADGRERQRTCVDAELRAAPLFVENDLVIHTDDGSLRRIRQGSGEVVWLARIESQPIDRSSAYGLHYSARPVLAAGVIYVGGFDGVVHGLDVASGHPRWSASVGAPATRSVTVVDETLLVGDLAGNVTALGLAAGSRHWQVQTGGAITSRISVADGLAYVGTRAYDLLAIDLADGSRQWRQYLWYSWVESSPVISGDRIYVGSSDAQRLSTYDRTTGELLWQTRTGGAALGAPAVSDTVIVVGVTGNSDYFVPHRASVMAVERVDGSVRWRWEPEPVPGFSGFLADPVIVGDRVFAADLQGNVVAFGLNSGQ